MKSAPFALAAALACAAALPAAAKGSGVAFVSSEKNNALTVVDAKTLAVVGTVPTCKRPRHMQTIAGGTQLVVACGDSKQADVIDVATRKSLFKVPLGDDPEIFDISADGKTLYVSNEEDSAVGIVDMATRKRVGEIKVGEEPEGVKLSPDGRTLYVTSEVASMVHVIDTATRKVTRNVPVGKRPRRFAFNADGSELWVSNELGASVSVISTKTHEVVATVTFEVKGMRADDISPVDLVPAKDGKTMYVGLGRANHVAFVDVASRQTRALVLAGKRAWGLGLNGDGTRLWVANGLSDDLTVIDTAAAKAVKTLPVGRVPHSVVVDD